MLPISGPFYESKTLQYGYRQIWRFRQPKPYTEPSPYQVWEYTGTDRLRSDTKDGYYDSGLVTNTSFSVGGDMPNYGRHRAHAINKALDKFQGNLSDRAGWAENIAQFGKSVEMINDRLVQLYRFADAVRRGNFGLAATVLSAPKPSTASKRKKFAQNFLEWEYGWSPLLRDVSSSVKILTETDFGLRRISGSGTSRDYFFVNTRSGDLNVGSRYFEFATFVVRARVQADVRVTNPNLFLAGQMGLIDPALPWKLVPFSFVVDWLVNVEQVLSACSCFLGVDLTHQCQSVRDKGSFKSESLTWWQEFDPAIQAVRTSSNHASSSRTNDNYWRQVGLPSPTLTVKPFTGWSLERGLQALSLLITVCK